MRQHLDGYSERTLNFIRFSGIAIPIIYIVYGILIATNVIDRYEQFSFEAFFVLGFWWVILAIVQFTGDIRDTKLNYIRIGGFHLVGAATLLFITGVPSIFAIFWIINVLSAFTFFSRKGLQVSILLFAAVSVLDILMASDGTTVQSWLYHFAAFSAVALSGLVILSIQNDLGLKYSISVQNTMLDVLQKDRFTVIINNLQESVISTDRHGIVQLYNAATLNLLDTNVPIRKKHIGNVLHLKDASGKPYTLLKELEKAVGTVIRDDLRMRFGMPEEIRVELTFTPIRSSYTKTEKTDSHDGYIIMLRDVTKAKSLEEERDEFISVVSHELRTPITVIEAEISNLQALMQHPDVSKEMKEDALAGAHSQVMYLAKMVNDLSALSRAERGVGDAIEEINLKDMVHSLYDEFSESAHEKGLKLNLDLSPKLSPLNSSRLYLEELLKNFINNSIKYTKAGSVTISAKQTGNEISFAVKDTGIGISKSDQEKVFNKFFRSEDYRTRETSGTGLGLYVSAKLAKKLGTKIVLVSRLNHGSVFSFSLPIGSKNVD